MANTYFNFKKFGIQQADCAQKVSTDACIFGALLSQKINYGNVLDIGTGTGLLAMMIAQENEIKIDAIELIETCANQALENIKNAPFAEKIKVINIDIKKFSPQKKYDFIICNPPFYNNTLPNIEANKAIARQNQTLNANDWKIFLPKLIQENTKIFLLLAQNELTFDYIESFASMDFLCIEKTNIYDNKDKVSKRCILEFEKKPNSAYLEKSFIIKADGDYSPMMKILMKDFYLNL